MTLSSQILKTLDNLYVRRNAPFSLVHFVTDRCNARCAHCFIDFSGSPNTSKELTVDEIGALTRSIGNGLFNVNITGGEPFIRNDIFEIVKSYVENTEVRSIVITTNGFYVEAIEGLAAKYKQLKTKCHINFSISIDNHERQHNANRNVEGLYARALESYRLIDAFDDKRVSASIALTVMPSNQSNIVDVFHHLLKQGVKDVFPVLLREEGVLKHIPDKSNVLHAYNELVRLIDEKVPGNIQGGTRSLFRAVQQAKNRIVHRILSSTYCSPRFIVPCNAGSLFGVIFADGRVSPCEPLDASWTLGNLREYEMDFAAIWKSPAAEMIRRKIRSRKCHCTFECAWSVNVLSYPVYWPLLSYHTIRELFWKPIA